MIFVITFRIQTKQKCWLASHLLEMLITLTCWWIYSHNNTDLVFVSRHKEFLNKLAWKQIVDIFRFYSRFLHSVHSESWHALMNKFLLKLCSANIQLFPVCLTSTCASEWADQRPAAHRAPLETWCKLTAQLLLFQISVILSVNISIFSSFSFKLKVSAVKMICCSSHWWWGYVIRNLLIIESEACLTIASFFYCILLQLYAKQQILFSKMHIGKTSS